MKRWFLPGAGDEIHRPHLGGDAAIQESSGQAGGHEQLLGREGYLRKNGRTTVPADLMLL